MAWTLADFSENRLEALLTLSEETVSAGTNPKTLTWGPADVPGIAGLYGLPLEILSVRMELTPTSATARRPMVEVLDSASDVIFETTSAFATSSTTLIKFDFVPGFSPGTSGIELIAGTTNARNALPIGLFLSPGQKLVATQDSVVDANDALVVHVRARVRKV
jgi:hypothetical protein